MIGLRHAGRSGSARYPVGDRPEDPPEQRRADAACVADRDTLVGFAAYGEVERALGGGGANGKNLKMDMLGDMAGIERRAKEVAREYDAFRAVQNALELDAGLLTGDKRTSREKLGTELDR